ncbi:hypothetical protein TSUD_153060 [Trifolium subterraneum]|uniref:Uncharacterized protein n=1 Tax=Trifolium subterraneum TaxID=3900 RepID=A0A2Z6MAJ5_TRISU|nr:hypothetical protein TSUD_153060 [Trifolium subterraneum]
MVVAGRPVYPGRSYQSSKQFTILLTVRDARNVGMVIREVPSRTTPIQFLRELECNNLDSTIICNLGILRECTMPGWRVLTQKEIGCDGAPERSTILVPARARIPWRTSCD